ncbi:MAG: hypothetical protein ACKOZV_03460, partial [Bacteroidota bacterium]
MINLRMIEFYRLGIALLMLMFFAGRVSAQASITITETSGAMANDGIILCGASVTLTANPMDKTYLWSTSATTQTITVNLGGTYSVRVIDGSDTTFASVVIEVTNDNTAPVAQCATITVQLDANGEALVDLDDVDNGSSDACSLVSLEVQDWFAAGDTCTKAVCVSDTMRFRAAVNGPNGGLNYESCIINEGPESWAYFEVISPGTIDMIIGTDTSGSSCEVAVWGPFSSPVCDQLDLMNLKFCLDNVCGGRRIQFTAQTGYYMLVLTNPDNITSVIYLNENKGTAVIDSLCNTDNMTGTRVYRCRDIGSRVVTLRVADQAGNTATCNAVVNVVDESVPVLTCPP